MYWYKYMENRFAKQLVVSGKIRINSLNYFKNLEKHGNAIGDNEENTLIAVSTIEGTKTGDQLNEIEQLFLPFAPGFDKSSFSISNINFAVPFHGKPTYGFCLSDVLSSDILEEMNKESEMVGNPPYDTCVRISNHISFKKLLEDNLKTVNLRYYGHGNCFYRSRDIPWDEWDRKSKLCPAFIKDPKFSWQKEVRIIFETLSHEDLEPIDFEIKEISNLCEIVDIT